MHALTSYTFSKILLIKVLEKVNGVPQEETVYNAKG